MMCSEHLKSFVPTDMFDQVPMLNNTSNLKINMTKKTFKLKLPIEEDVVVRVRVSYWQNATWLSSSGKLSLQYDTTLK